MRIDSPLLALPLPAPANAAARAADVLRVPRWLESGRL